MDPERRPAVRVRGARGFGLQGVDVDLPVGALIAVTGRSGAGKTSLALRTVFGEGRRRMLELLGAPAIPGPDVDAILGLPPVVAVEAGAGLEGRRVAEVLQVGGLLRALFRRHGALRLPDGSLARPRDPAALRRELDLLPDGARVTVLAPLPQMEDPARVLDELRRQAFTRVRIGDEIHRIDDLVTLPLDRRVDLVLDRLACSPERRARLAEAVDAALRVGRGRALLEVDGGRPMPLSQDPWIPEDTPGGGAGVPWPTDEALSWRSPCGGCGGAGCAACGGTGLGEAAGRLLLGDLTLRGALALRVNELHPILMRTPSDPRLEDALLERLSGAIALGLGHLPLAAAEVGDGEADRLRLLRATLDLPPGVLVVVDEPCARLMGDQRARVLRHLCGLRDRGQTLLVIDHGPDLLGVAEHEVELGAAGGVRSGVLRWSGPPRGAPPLRAPQLRPAATDGLWSLRGASGDPLRAVDLHLPAGAWTTVTGPSGAGKTRLVVHTLCAALRGMPALPHRELRGPEAVLTLIDRVTATRARHACVATLMEAWGPIRELLAQTPAARAAGFGPEAFSFNRPEGRCPTCEGAGEVVVELGPLPAAAHGCPTCLGGRFADRVLTARWRGLSAAELLALRADAAGELFQRQPAVARATQALCAVGLGWMPLGRAAHTLSTGETQRLHLARLISAAGRGSAGKPRLLVADGPDVGLGPDDTPALAAALRALCAAGHTVLTVSYSADLIDAADHALALPGPG